MLVTAALKVIKMKSVKTRKKKLVKCEKLKR